MQRHARRVIAFEPVPEFVHILRAKFGDNVVIGGNAFLTSSVEPDTVVSVKNPEMTFRGKRHKRE